MEKNQQVMGEVSLSPIYPGGTNPNQHYVAIAAPPSSSMNNNNPSNLSPQINSDGTYYVITDASTIQNNNFRQTANLGLLPPSHPGPPIGRWRDSICSWAANLWPSCGCLLVLCGAWHVAQSKLSFLIH